MLVGHEPDLSALIYVDRRPCACARGVEEGGLCALALDATSLKSKADAEAQAATLLWLMTARALGSIAKSGH